MTMLRGSRGGRLGGAGRGRGRGGLPVLTAQSHEIDAEDFVIRDILSAWKRLMKSTAARYDLNGMAALWGKALQILETGGNNTRQRVAKAISIVDNETNGLEHVRVILDMPRKLLTSPKGLAIAKDFLAVVTHDSILDCLSVDHLVGDLYNFISGAGGERGISFLQILCSHLSQQCNSTAQSLESTDMIVLSVATCLCQILWRIPRYSSNEGLPKLIASLQSLSTLVRSDVSSTSHYALVQRVGQVTRLLDRYDNSIVQASINKARGTFQSPTVSTYPREAEMPGGRHDNDKADITQLKIFPTEAEIRCDLPEFLPLANIGQPGFHRGPERLLDTHFRLLRHDIFGEYKTAIGGLLKLCDEAGRINTDIAGSLANIRASHYNAAQVRYVSMDRSRRGIEFQIGFRQPYQLQGKSGKTAPGRQTWWQSSKRLEEGTLLALLSFIDGKCTVILLTVSKKSTNAAAVPPNMDKKNNLSTSSACAVITTRLASPNDSAQLKDMISLSLRSTSSTHLLIEFPGVLPATFVPILQNLQQMQQSSVLPFTEWIAPEVSDAANRSVDLPINISPPVYARARGFQFDLSPILSNPTPTLALNPNEAIHPELLQELTNRTSLDKGQCDALLSALTTEFSLVQGPPGTGKSYLGLQLTRVLLHNRTRANLGPIIVVCYTNHALDQFLEHLIESGVQKVIRIGGQSTSELLKGKNLKLIAKEEGKTGTERYQLALSFKSQEAIEKRVKSKLATLHRIGPDWKSFAQYLESKHPQIYSQFSLVQDDGFELVGRDDPFDRWMKGERKPGNTVTAANTVPGDVDIWEQSPNDRLKIVDAWTKDFISPIIDEIADLVEDFEGSKQSSSDVYDEVDRRVLDTAHVIGVTTTGLANRISVLRRIKAKVVVCEEAGEVLEAHMVSTLIPHVEHLIQIGDHQQLRPQINNFGLSLESTEGHKYALDRSQFERLCSNVDGKGSFPVSQLNLQRRMRPEISRLIRQTQYPGLLDHASVQNKPDVIGIRKNVFWIDHRNPETALHPGSISQSKSNDWEIDMAHALIRHVVLQGVYTSNDIAVLTPYAGQLQKLRSKLGKDFEVVLSERDEEELTKVSCVTAAITDSAESATTAGPALQKKSLDRLLRIATVDNFQGEEAKIVIVSLVRSNENRSVGFLRTENRINVLLSRAKEGMYLIGNAETYENIPMWAKVLGLLRLEDCVGESLSLCCPRHPDTLIEVSQAETFVTVSPEGGCNLTCVKRLDDCGHRCMAKCHSDAMHRAFSCPQPCQRLRETCGHDCPKLCGDSCGPCQTIVNNLELPCGHKQDGLACHLTLMPGEITCSVPVQKTVPSCSHSITVPCSEDVTMSCYECPVSCEGRLECGHDCGGTCGKCIRAQGSDHVVCKVRCGKRLSTCNHFCENPCHSGTNCEECVRLCEVRCKHSRCTKSCNEPCAPCVQDCTWHCEHHGACDMPCSAPCNRLPCSKRCTYMLECDHQCPSVCGENCPSTEYCQQCGSQDRLTQHVDMIMFTKYKDIDLNETPIIVLDCGHFFTIGTIDGVTHMSDVYQEDASTQNFTGLIENAGSLSGPSPCCPTCRGVIQPFTTQRYNRVINRTAIDEMSKRFLVNGQRKISTMSLETDVVRTSLEAGRTAAVRSAHGSSLEALKVAFVNYIRHPEIVAQKLLRDIEEFLKEADDSCQPARKLHDATVKAMRKTENVETALGRLDVSSQRSPATPRDHRVIFGGRVLSLRANFVIFEHRLLMINELDKKMGSTGAGLPQHELNLVRHVFEQCRSLIFDCDAESLPKIKVEAIILFASAARILQAVKGAGTNAALESGEKVVRARALLVEALKLCQLGFENAQDLRVVVEGLQKTLNSEWYEPMSETELELVKQAMVSGRGGIATHAGHWYNCLNGHPFAIGECGMPMEQARCPQCGEPIGGTDHRAVGGVTRATQMED